MNPTDTPSTEQTASAAAPAAPPAAPGVSTVAPVITTPKKWKKWLIPAVVVVVLMVAGVVAWTLLRPKGPGAGFVSGNGRIEATEIDVATKLPGRVQEIMVNEGDFVLAGQPLAQMQLDVLDAQRSACPISGSRQRGGECQGASRRTPKRQGRSASGGRTARKRIGCRAAAARSFRHTVSGRRRLDSGAR